ncbi:MAG: 2OG-Fe(II) oxygenase [Nitrospira sp.]|nr:2OG-Fe(II) oxygenase [Nitrospira sp.]
MMRSQRNLASGLPNLHAVDWIRVEHSILTSGYAHLPRVVQSPACRSLRTLYDDNRWFRSRIVMGRYNFGQGEYSYFAYPLPTLVSHIRTHLYTHLAPIANRMMDRLNRSPRYPATLTAFHKECRRHGQIQPTPLLLRYHGGDFNCLHRDVYGPTLFPLQAMVMLSRKGQEFEGGEFVLVENRPRQQARVTAFNPDLGDIIIFPVHERPVQGQRGYVRASMRHGVSPVRTGQRYVLGVIFHEAK